MTASHTNYVAQSLSRLYPLSSPIHRGVVDSAAAYGSTDLGSNPVLALAPFVISDISDKVKTRPTRGNGRERRAWSWQNMRPRCSNMCPRCSSTCPISPSMCFSHVICVTCDLGGTHKRKKYVVSRINEESAYYSVDV